MKKMLMASAVALLGPAAVPAAAMPVAPLTDLVSGLTRVAMGCGPGWTRGPYGRCHPMGYVAPGPAYGVYAHPYGYHPYAYGRRCWWRAGVRVCA
jgi:hypothetical protein